MEHRWGRRQDTNIHVFFYALPATSGAGRLLNISCSGAWLETSVNLRLHSLLYLESLDDRAPSGARTSATIVRRTAHGVGLEWCHKDGLFQRCHLGAMPESTALAPSTSHLMRQRTHAA
jgi:hypothetical protein